MATEFIPYPLRSTDMPVDISFVFETEKPAGKHGFLQAKGDHFEFEDGTLGRFWGVALNAAAAFPPHDHAEALARRLAKTGVNLVRMHQIDTDYATPNIFQFARGPLLKTTRKLDPQSMERLDYLIYCLKNEGIYICMDLLVSRLFLEADGVPNGPALGKGANPYAMFDRQLIALQKEFNEQLLTHVNPYTGLAYVDDPAIAMSGIINECTLFKSVKKGLLEPYATAFWDMFRAWCQKNGIQRDLTQLPDFSDYGDADLTRFKVEAESAYYREMREHLLSIGVKYPISGSNYLVHSGMFAANSDMDYRDNHMYFHRFFDVPGTTWREDMGHKLMPMFSLTSKGDCGFTKLMHMRSLDKPFMVTEWNMTWPNEYRAEAPLLYAAVGSFQGFGGISIHTYSYQNVQKDDMLLGKETVSGGLGGVPYREGIFSSWNDPAIFGLFYHAALMLRRGDVTEATRKIAIQTDPVRSREIAPCLAGAKDPYDWYVNWKRYDRMSPCYYTLAEVAKVGTCLENTIPADADQVFTEPKWPVDLSTQEVRSDNGQLYRNWGKNYGIIDSEKTKCVYGLLGKNQELKLQNLTVACENDFATLAMSSLTDDGLSRSENILLTTVGRARNTNAEFYGDQMVKWGQLPVEVEVIRATVQLETEIPNLKVYSITPEGMIQGTLPSTYKNGVLTFTVGNTWKSMYYLIQAT